MDALISGQDVLGVMPTGAGKSVCYQVPALVRGGVTIVVSPLISLMTDQVTSLISSGVPAAYLNSTLTSGQIELATQRALQGRYRLIYVAPERLETYSMRQIASSGMISLIAVDEAHCVSQWGQDFRPDYLRISEFVDSLPKRPPVGAFTATATPSVRQDICRYLHLRKPLEVATGFDRPNLFFDVMRPEDRFITLERILENHGGECGIVYCSTRKEVDALAERLSNDGFTAAKYHAGLSDDERAYAQESFQNENVRIIIATNAFGMGIDKKNVRFVIHYNMPRSVEAYYQEAGRAGRDGNPAECIMFHNGKDILTAKYLINHSEGRGDMTDRQRNTIRQRDMQRLQSMIDYSTTNQCFRKIILNYFGEKTGDKCCSCGNCTGKRYSEKLPLGKAPVGGVSAKKPAKVAETTVIKPIKRKVDRTVENQPVIREMAGDKVQLMEDLRRYRLGKAKQMNVPAYVVFSDATMNNIAVAVPHNKDELMQVKGIGKVKADQFGSDILQVIAKWRIGSGEPVSAAKAVMDKMDSSTAFHNAAPWTEEETAILRRAFASGMTLDTLSTIHGRTIEDIIEQLKILGLTE